MAEYYLVMSETEDSTRHIRKPAHFFAQRAEAGTELRRYTMCGISIPSDKPWFVHTNHEADCETCLVACKEPNDAP